MLLTRSWHKLLFRNELIVNDNFCRKSLTIRVYVVGYAYRSWRGGSVLPMTGRVG